MFSQITEPPTREMAVGRKMSVFGTEVCFIRSISSAATKPMTTVTIGTMKIHSTVCRRVCNV